MRACLHAETFVSLALLLQERQSTISSPQLPTHARTPNERPLRNCTTMEGTPLAKMMLQASLPAAPCLFLWLADLALYEPSSNAQSGPYPGILVTVNRSASASLHSFVPTLSFLTYDRLSCISPAVCVAVFEATAGFSRFLASPAPSCSHFAARVLPCSRVATRDRVKSSRPSCCATSFVRRRCESPRRPWGVGCSGNVPDRT